MLSGTGSTRPHNTESQCRSKSRPVTFVYPMGTQGHRPVLFPAVYFPPRFVVSILFMTLPEDCASLDEVRTEIDRIDHWIIGMIAQRALYVDAAVKFKTSEQHVAAPERQAAMLRVRREGAAEAGLD